MRLHGPDRPHIAVHDNILGLFGRPPLEKLGNGAGCLLRGMSVEAGDATRTQDTRDTRRPKRRSGPHGSEVTGKFCRGRTRRLVKSGRTWRQRPREVQYFQVGPNRPANEWAKALCVSGTLCTRSSQQLEIRQAQGRT
jgi:hypothetical protein